MLIRKSAIDTIIDQSIDQLNQSDFITRCLNQTISLIELNNFCIQHAYYAQYFTRYLCAFISNIDLPNFGLYSETIDNLADEVGLNGHVSHYILYNQLLDDLGLRLDKSQINTSTQELITTMFNYCRQSNITYGMVALCLGAEAIVPTMYSHVLKGFKHHNIALDKLKYFSIHIDCDADHADSFKKYLEIIIRKDSKSLDLIKQVTSSIIQKRINFFNELTIH